jgi:hypothetical protein
MDWERGMGPYDIAAGWWGLSLWLNEVVMFFHAFQVIILHFFLLGKEILCTTTSCSLIAARWKTPTTVGGLSMLMKQLEKFPSVFGGCDLISIILESEILLHALILFMIYLIHVSSYHSSDFFILTCWLAPVSQTLYKEQSFCNFGLCFCC